MRAVQTHQDLKQEFMRALVFLMVVIFGGLTIREYMRWLKTAPVFQIQRIDIEGNDLLSDERIRKMGVLVNQAPIWNVDLGAAEKSIESVGYVDDAIVRRRLPGVIQVQVIEKKPVALLRHQGKLYCLDPDAQVLPSEPGKMYDLPILSGNFEGDIQVGQTLGGQWVPKGLAILQRIRVDRPALYPEISEILLGKEEGILLYTCRNGIPVYAGEDMSWSKIRCFDAILRELMQKGALGSTRYIDLRYRGQIFVGRRA